MILYVCIYGYSICANELPAFQLFSPYYLSCFLFQLKQCCKENRNTDIRVTVVDWIDNLDSSVEGRRTFQGVLEEVDDLVRTCNSNSIRSHNEHSKVKVKKKYKSEGSTGTGTGTGGMSTTSPAVRAPAVLTSTAAVHLRAEDDPLGLLCSHLVCPSLSHVTRSTG